MGVGRKTWQSMRDTWQRLMAGQGKEPRSPRDDDEAEAWLLVLVVIFCLAISLLTMCGFRFLGWAHE